MDDVVPTLDDSDRQFLHHPNEPISEGFSFDPESADAAADLAGELGADFVEGATRGRDMSDVMVSEENMNDETPFVLEMLGEGAEETLLPEDEDLDVEVPPAKYQSDLCGETESKRARRGHFVTLDRKGDSRIALP